MFGVKAADRMAGLKALTTVNIDMRKCISRDDQKSKLDMDVLNDVLEDLFSKWTAMRKFKEELTGVKAFRMEHCLSVVAGLDKSVFDGITGIYIMYPDREVRITVYHAEDLLSVYNGITSRGRTVKIQNKSDDVVIIKEVPDFDNTSSMTNEFFCIDCRCGMKYGALIPAGIKIKTPIKMNCNKLLTPIVVTEHGVIEINGSCVVETFVPIVADGVEEVVICGSGILNLTSNADMQPCIGTITTTGMSGGRWSPCGRPPKRIIVDGVVVNCVSKVEAFTLGKYGEAAVPEIILKNNGRIICPEATGERIVTKWATAPDGSTKISDKMEYGIFKSDILIVDMVNPLVREKIKYLPEKVRSAVTPTTQIANIDEACRLLKMNENLDVSLVLDGQKRINYARTAALLHNNDIYCGREFELEQKKVNYLADRYSDRSRLQTDTESIDAIGIVGCLIIAVHDTLSVSASEYSYEVMYEMIPSYMFDGWIKGDKKASVEKYVDENANLRKIIGKIRNHLKISDCIHELNM